MTKTQKIILGICLLTLVLTLGACSFKSAKISSDEPVKIGVIAPLSGDAALWGQNGKKGIDLAFEKINKQYPNKFEVVYEDSNCDAKTSVNIISKLINSDKIHYFIGDFCSSSTLAIAKVAEENKAILITPASSADSISQAGDYIFRVYVRNDQLASKIAQLAEKENYQKAAAIYIKNDYGESLKNSFVNNYKNGQVVALESYAPDTKDFRTELLKIKSENPEMIFIASYYNDGALILKQAKELGITAKFFAPDSFDDPETLKIAGLAAEGLMVVTVSGFNGPAKDDFTQNYKDKFQSDPVFLSDYDYDALNLIAQAVRAVGDNPNKVKDYFYGLKDFPGVSDKINFDANGDVVNPAIMVKTVKDGEFVKYE